MRLLFFCLMAGSAGCALFRSTPDLPLPELVRVPGGTFLMGDVFDFDNTDALPVHEVTVPGFEIMTHEVTYAQYDAYARAVERPLPEDDGKGRGERAVVTVNWEEAQAYCEAHGMRLPTEAEWEYAARSGGQPQRYAGTDSLRTLPAYAWFDNSHLGVFKGIPVRQKHPNALGVYDMSGNVHEWIGAYYQFYPKPGEAPAYSDLETSGIRILRGGSYDGLADYTQTFWRMGTLRDERADNIGFRCVKPG